MPQISNSRRVLGISILIGIVFYSLNGITNLIANYNSISLLFLIVVVILGYIIAFVIILKQPFVPKFVMNKINELRKM